MITATERNPMTHLARWISCMLVLLLLAACESTPTPASDAPLAPDETTDTDATDSSNTATDKRGTLHVAHSVFWGGIESLDPASSTLFLDTMRPLYDTLVRPDEHSEPAPSLATAWESNDDVTVWTFTLRDDVVFHDGTPCTSADVAYTFERILAPDSESLASSVLGIIETIETPDDQTVVFTLSRPHAELPVLFLPFYTSIVPADSGETIGETGIGTGPFKLENLDPEGTTRLVANDDYWQGTPGLAALELIGIPDADTRLQALHARQIDLLFEPSPQQVEVLEGRDEFIVQRFPAGGWYSIEMRTDTPPFDDVRVRKAMRLVADRQEILDLVFQGEGTVTCDTTVWPGDPHRWDGVCEQDLAQARDLLAEAGYPDGLDVTLYTSNSMQPMVPLAEVYQQQAAEAGINVTIEQVPPDIYWTDVWGIEPLATAGDLQYPADMTLHLFYHSESPYNTTHFNNAAFDQLLADARSTFDPEERNARYQEAQQFLFNEGGRLVPFHQTELRAFSNLVAGIEPVPQYDLPWHLVTKAAEE